MNISKPSKKEKTNICRTSEDAFEKICLAFADFGIMLKINQDVRIKGISEKAQTAVIESYYSDPHFFKGMRLLHRFFRPEEIEPAKNIILPIANELYIAAQKIDAARAQANLRTIEMVMSWLCEKAH